jgi:hypothetical protein
MNSIRRRLVAVIVGLCAASFLSIPEASADILPAGVKQVRLQVFFNADRFDDYCEHGHVVVKGDTYEALAKRFYGDRERAAELAAANSQFEATRLPIGAKLVIPPKKAVPADAKETLAWTFWGLSGRFNHQSVQRVDPGEIQGVAYEGLDLLAVPADKLAEFEKLVAAAREKEPTAVGRSLGQVLNETPWVLCAEGLRIDPYVQENSSAVERTITFRIVELTRNDASHGRFVVKMESVELKDRDGNVVKAGFDLLLTWRGIPFGLIALIGALGLARLRRQRSCTPE